MNFPLYTLELLANVDGMESFRRNLTNLIIYAGQTVAIVEGKVFDSDFDRAILGERVNSLKKSALYYRVPVYRLN